MDSIETECKLQDSIYEYKRYILSISCHSVRARLSKHSRQNIGFPSKGSMAISDCAPQSEHAILKVIFGMLLNLNLSFFKF